MAFGGEVHHYIRLELGESARDFGSVANIGTPECVSRLVSNGGEGIEIARVSEFIKNHYFSARLEYETSRNRRTYKAGTAGDEYTHPRLFQSF
jgi:hypothetical protein